MDLMGPHDGSARLDEPRSDSMDTPLSILVCVRNRADLTRSFLDTLLPTIDKASAELLVYDDLSTDGTPALLEACAQNEGASLGGGTTIVRGDAPGCFGANMNALASRAYVHAHLVTADSSCLVIDRTPHCCQTVTEMVSWIWMSGCLVR